MQYSNQLSPQAESKQAEPPSQLYATPEYITYLQQLAESNTAQAFKILQEILISKTSFLWFKHVINSSHSTYLDLYCHLGLKRVLMQSILPRDECDEFMVWAKQIIEFADEFVIVEITTVFAAEVAIFYRYQLDDHDCKRFLEFLVNFVEESKKPNPRLLVLKIILEIIEVIKVDPSTHERKTINHLINRFLYIAFKIYSVIVIPTDDSSAPFTMGYNMDYKNGIIDELSYFSLLLIKECLEFDFFNVKKDKDENRIQSEFLESFSPICIPMKGIHKNQMLLNYSIFKSEQLTNELYFLYCEQTYAPLRVTILTIIGGMLRIYPKFFMVGPRDIIRHHAKVNELLAILERFSSSNLEFTCEQDISILMEYGRTLKKSIIFNKISSMDQQLLKNIVINTTEFFSATFFDKKIMYTKVLSPYFEYFNKLQKYDNYPSLSTKNVIISCIKCFKSRFLNTLMDVMDARRDGNLDTQEYENISCIRLEMDDDLLLNNALLEEYLQILRTTCTDSMEEEINNEDIRILYKYIRFQNDYVLYHNVKSDEEEKEKALTSIVLTIQSTLDRINDLRTQECIPEDIVPEKVLSGGKIEGENKQSKSNRLDQQIQKEIHHPSLSKKSGSKHTKNQHVFERSEDNGEESKIIQKSIEIIEIDDDQVSFIDEIEKQLELEELEKNRSNAHFQLMTSSQNVEESKTVEKPIVKPQLPESPSQLQKIREENVQKTLNQQNQSPTKVPHPSPSNEDRISDMNIIARLLDNDQTILKYRILLHHCVSKFFEPLSTQQCELPYNQIALELLEYELIDYKILYGLLIRTSQSQQQCSEIKQHLQSMLNQALFANNSDSYLQYIKLFTLVCDPQELIEILNFDLKSCLPKLLAILQILHFSSYFSVADSLTDWFFKKCYPFVVSFFRNLLLPQHILIVGETLEIFTLLLKINRSREVSEYKKDYLLEELDVIVGSSTAILMSCELLQKELRMNISVYYYCIEQLINTSSEVLRMQNRLFSTATINPHYVTLCQYIPFIVEILNLNPQFWMDSPSRQKLILTYLESFISFQPVQHRFIHDENFKNLVVQTIPASIPFLTRYTQHPLLSTIDREQLIKQVVNATLTQRLYTYFEWISFVKFYRQNQDIVNKLSAEQSLTGDYFDLIYEFQDIHVSSFGIIDTQFQKIEYFKYRMEGNEETGLEQATESATHDEEAHS